MKTLPQKCHFYAQDFAGLVGLYTNWYWDTSGYKILGLMKENYMPLNDLETLVEVEYWINSEGSKREDEYERQSIWIRVVNLERGVNGILIATVNTTSVGLGLLFNLCRSKGFILNIVRFDNTDTNLINASLSIRKRVPSDKDEFTHGRIYRVTNNITHKSYVGKTRGSLKNRWKAHVRASYRGSNDRRSLLARAIALYGEEHFKVSVLETVRFSELAVREGYWIRKLHTQTPSGYNKRGEGENE